MARLTILCGGGGVGKTSTAAALGVALARKGERTLVVTIDPARRLADALGVTIGPRVCTVALPGIPTGMLSVRMPEGRTLANDFVEWLFEDPAAIARIQSNTAYHELANAIVGANELFAISLIERDLQSGEYDHVVLDTAPSRHALYFLTYPKQLLDLLDAKALKWIAELATPKEGDKPGGIFAWGREQVEAMFSRAIGHDAVMSVAALLGEVVHVRKKWAVVIRAGYQRLLGGGAKFVLVGAPSGAAVDDVRYLSERLKALGPSPAAIVLNRADTSAPSMLDAVARELDGSAAHVALREVIDRLRGEYDARATAAKLAVATLSLTAGANTPFVRLPYVTAREPSEIVLALADEMTALIAALAD